LRIAVSPGFRERVVERFSGLHGEAIWIYHCRRNAVRESLAICSQGNGSAVPHAPR
jgi:hypothetical protein